MKLSFKQFLIVILLLTALVTAETNNNQNKYDFKKARERMVELQIKSRGINDNQVLNTMLSVQRHLFIPDSLWRYAYYDGPLPIDAGQTISQPYIVAYMTEKLKLDSKSKVLEIGTGSGYQAAVLAEICDSVFTIEIIELLAKKSDSLLKSLGYQNITVKHGDGYIGWQEHAPFDGIIVTAAPPYIPQPLLDQLSEGGRMIIPVGTDYQQLILFEKQNNNIIESKLIPVRFVPMTGEAQKVKDSN